MPSDKTIEKLLREHRAELEEDRKEREELAREMRELKQSREAPDGMSRMRDAYAESDPEAIREARQAARKKGGSR